MLCLKQLIKNMWIEATNLRTFGPKKILSKIVRKKKEH